MYKYLLVIFLSLFLFANDETLILNDDSKYYENFQISFSEDKRNDTTILHIINQDFTETIQNKFTFGHLKNGLWLKFNVQNNSNTNKYILNLNESIYDYADLYYFNGDILVKKENGITKYFENREIKRKEIAYVLDIKTDEKKVFYLYLKGTLANIGNMTISTEEYYFNDTLLTSDNFIIYSLGVISFIFLFNLFLFVSLKERIYLYYIGYVFSCLVIIFNSSGFPIYVNLQNIIYELQAFNAIAFIFFNLFSMELFSTKVKFPRIHLLLQFFIISSVLITILSLFHYNPWIYIKNIHMGLNIIFLLGLSIYIYIKEKSKIKYYIFALLLYVFFMSLTQQMVLGNIEYTFLTRHGFIIAIVIENIIFSLFLASRYNTLKNESLKFQEELLIVKDKNGAFLEKEVNKKTEKLTHLALEKELLLKEVVHRVKNNFHIIIGAIWFESRKKKVDKQNFIDLINRVQSMSHIHDFLYREDDISNIEINYYLKTLINQIVLTYNNKNIKVDFQKNEKILLELEYGASLGIIVNEIITNIIKHNLNSEGLFISIILECTDNNFVLKILYNGKKFNVDQKTKGLGLKLIEDFSKSLPNCKYKYIFAKEVLFHLSFEKELNE